MNSTTSSSIIPVKIQKIGNKNTLKKHEFDLEPSNFSVLDIDESGIEDFVASHSDLIFGEDETILIVGQQAVDQRSKKCDLIAISSDGSIVIIEIKRDKKDVQYRTEAFEVQAIRYAASLSTIKTTEELHEKIFKKYLEKNAGKIESADSKKVYIEKAEKSFHTFIAQNGISKNFNGRQRIVLIASGFDNETLAAASWLSLNGIDIKCVRLYPMKFSPPLNCEFIFLGWQLLIPLPVLEDYLVGYDLPIGDVVDGEVGVGLKRRRRASLPRMDWLITNGVVGIGDWLTINRQQDSAAKIIDHKTVEFNDEKMTFNDWGKKVTGWTTINIYDWAMKNTDLLTDLRQRKIDEMELGETNEAQQTVDEVSE